MTTPIDDLVKSTRDVMTLLNIHEERSAPAKGRRKRVEALNKSSIVLLVACWEAFVEGIALRGAAHLADQHSTSDMVPTALRGKVSRRIREDKNDNAPWNLAGDGWRAVLVAYVNAHVGRLNLPNSENVDDLFDRCLGIARVSDSWRLDGSANRARGRLNKLIGLRGAIAHGGALGATVTVRTVRSYFDLILSLAVTTEIEVHRHLMACTGKAPWRSN